MATTADVQEEPKPEEEPEDAAVPQVFHSKTYVPHVHSPPFAACLGIIQASRLGVEFGPRLAQHQSHHPLRVSPILFETSC